jgi:myo-inositol-1(or 4)-monophosphatase
MIRSETNVFERCKARARRSTKPRYGLLKSASSTSLCSPPGSPYDRRENADFYLTFFKAFLARSQGIRRNGSAALDLCYVACGRLDGFWELKLKPWDTAAGALIVKEAGGRLSDFAGKSFSIWGTETMASNGLIHDEMLRIATDASRVATSLTGS